MAYSYRGYAWNAKKDYAKALADYNEAIRLDPNDVQAYNNRGYLWFDKKDYDKALADYDEAIRLDPTRAIVYNNLGGLWFAKKDYAKALADYNEAIRLDPAYATTYNNRGYLWFAKKDYAKALADYNEAIHLDPTYAIAFNNRAWLFATCPDPKHRDGNQALDSAGRACELSGWKNANHIGTLAAANAEAGDFAKAIEWEEKALKLYVAPEDKKKGEDRLRLYKDKKPYRDEG
jgi:tetratricopeptide (TPR) repeat protein